MIKTIVLLAVLAGHVNAILSGGRSGLLYAFGHAAIPLFSLLWAINLPPDLPRLRQRTRRIWVWLLLFSHLPVLQCRNKSLPKAFMYLHIHRCVHNIKLFMIRERWTGVNK